MIIQLLALSSAIGMQVSLADTDIVFAQGRASEILLLDKLAKRCGVKAPLVSYVRGPEFYHHPAEPGAELSISASAVTEGARDCLRKGVPVLLRRLKTVTLKSDAL